MENNIRTKLLIIGISWPPETFLQRLIRGLNDAGVEVTVACGERPGREWLTHPKFRWLRAPSWNVSVAQRLWNLIRLLVGGLIRDSATVWKILPLTAGSFTDRLRLWYKLLPFVGRELGRDLFSLELGRHRIFAPVRSGPPGGGQLSGLPNKCGASGSQPPNHVQGIKPHVSESRRGTLRFGVH